MSNSLTEMAITVQNQTPPEAKQRKAYHKPRMEHYGAVSELTRTGTYNPNTFDGIFYYSSAN